MFRITTSNMNFAQDSLAEKLCEIVKKHLGESPKCTINNNIEYGKKYTTYRFKCYSKEELNLFPDFPCNNWSNELTLLNSHGKWRICLPGDEGDEDFYHDSNDPETILDEYFKYIGL